MRNKSVKKLKIEDIPPPEADWMEISKFALTFNGYAAHGSFQECAKIANARRHESLNDLRTCLFFEQRRWRHFGEAPRNEEMKYIRELIQKIRKYVIDNSSKLPKV
jgi:hypothetical protein